MEPTSGQAYGLPVQALEMMQATFGEVIYDMAFGRDKVRLTLSLQDRIPIQRRPQDAKLASVPSVDLQTLLEGALRETLLRLAQVEAPASQQSR